MKRMLLLAVTVTFTGCARPGDHPVSPNCDWTEEDNRPLNLENAVDRRHLSYDAITAEDMSIRWADRYAGRGSGQFKGFPEYGRRQNECMEALFNGIASYHGVDVALVRQYRLNRNIVLDSAVMLGFGVFYALVAYGLAGPIRRRFPPDERAAFLIATVAMSVVASLIGVLLGDFWSVVMENLRLNSGHLSYRLARIPWRQHWAALFICGLIVFWLAAAVRSRVRIRIDNRPSFRG